MWPWASSAAWWNSTPSCSQWEWGSSARLTCLPALSNATDTTIPLLQQQPGIGEMPFQIFLCKGVIYRGYGRGNPGYLLLLAPGEQTPGWEGFLTLWKTHPHYQKQIPQEQHSPQELSRSAERGKAQHTCTEPFPSLRAGITPPQSRMIITRGSRPMISVSSHHQPTSSRSDTSGQWLLTSCRFLRSHLTKHIKTTL